MKREQLLEAIGGVDEGLLMETEATARRQRIGLGRVALIAAVVAALGITVAAASGAFSRPIEAVDVISGETVAPFDMDAEGNIIPGGIEGLKITMDVQIDEAAPEYLEELYLIEPPEGWNNDGMETVSGRYWLCGWDQILWQTGKSGRVKLEQSTVHNYLASGHQVDSLFRLSEKDGVSIRKAHMAGLEVLKVTIPALPWYDEGDGHLYCADGETRLYWSDGQYILKFTYPAWVSDAEAEEMLSTLHTEPLTMNVPADFGTVNVLRQQSLKRLFHIDEGGNTSANIQMSQGRVAYRDGTLYFSGPGRVLSYELETGETDTYFLSYAYTHPSYLFVTENYLGYVSDYDMLEVLPLDKSAPETALYEGISSINLFADGMDLYAQGDGLRRINMSTGEVTALVDDVHSYYVGDRYVYVIQGDGQKHFLRAEKGSSEFERVELSFYPIRVIADGEDLYFCTGGEGTTYNMVHYRDGAETKLPINAYFYQILDGYVIYRDQNGASNTIKSYNLETGEIQVLQENVFEFSVLEDRYVVFDVFNSDSIILDWQTGERVTVPTGE